MERHTSGLDCCKVLWMDNRWSCIISKQRGQDNMAEPYVLVAMYPRIVLVAAINYKNIN